ncbi:TPA: phage tail protein, partial [Klebsiella pneumoniae]
SALPVGVPVPWPLATVPTGWLKCNGAAFTAAQYPKLALAYPSLKLPDLRGEFIRGWGDARGVDSGRALMSSQSDAFQDHHHSIVTKGSGEGSLVSYSEDSGITSNGDSYLVGAGFYETYNASMQSSSRTAGETRPRNIAFNFIVRAA